MKQNNIDYLKKTAEDILAIASPSGFTKDVTEYLMAELSKLGYDSYQTIKGNVMVDIVGEDQSYNVGVSSHVDTLGLMVRAINADGTLAFTEIGGPILNTYDGEYCTIITRDNKRYSGTVLSNAPSVHVYPDSRKMERVSSNMHIRIDEVVKNKEDVQALGISNGDIIAIDPKVVINDAGFIKSRFLDDKISVALSLTVLKMMKDDKIKPRYNTTFMFSVYEEVGHGLSWIPQNINEVLSVDMGCIGLDLACTEYDVSICAKDSSGPYDYGMVTKLIDIAKDKKLSYAVDIYPFYGSDTSAALRGGNNIKGALIGPGVHASHGMERTHIDGVGNTIALLLGYLQ